MRYAILSLSIAIALCVSDRSMSVAAAEAEKDPISMYLDHAKYESRAGGEWGSALYTAIAQDLDVAKAAAQLAPRFGWSVEHTEKLAQLWIQWTNIAESYDLEQDQKDRLLLPVDEQFLSLVRATGHAPLVVKLAATAISQGGSRCTPRMFEEIVKDSKNAPAVEWIVASATDCADWWSAYAARRPTNFALLLPIATDERLSPHEKLALLDILQDNRNLAKTSAPSRRDLRLWLARAYIYALWDQGLAADGLSYYDNLPTEIRSALTAKSATPNSIAFDGLDVDITVRFSGDTPVDKREFQQDLAAALYVTGKTEQARSLFRRLSYGAEAKKQFECIRTAQRGDRRCDPSLSEDFADYLMLDLALDGLDRDPYDYVEQALGGFSIARRTALWDGVFVKLLSDHYRPAIKSIASSRLWAASYYDERSQTERATLSGILDRMLGPGFHRKAESYQAKRDAELQHWRQTAGPEATDYDLWKTSRTASPGPSRFMEHPVPVALRTELHAPLQDELSWPKDWAPLPGAHSPVRVEQNGSEAIAVTLSQSLDPTGEISGGGYWIHLSHDGGKSWDRPLYTGIAEYYPYVVVPQSRLPLLNGDRIQLEVEVKELDLSSITYPPVGLQLKRDERDLYLDIPVAELAMDSDRDGISDIQEEHFLLDPHNADSDDDGIKDGEDPLPNVKQMISADPTHEALTSVLEHLFSVSFGGIIESVRTPDSAPTISSQISGWRFESDSRDRPIFVVGNPSDYAGFRPNRMMFVYTAADIERLRTMTPDFHAVTLEPLTFDRSGERAFAKWSAGWTGGTIRLTLENGVWKVEEISHWIT